MIKRRLRPAEVREIADRLAQGCPTKGVTLSPWCVQLQADARSLLEEVRHLRRLLGRVRA